MFPTLVGIGRCFFTGLFYYLLSGSQLALQRVFRARQTVLAGAGDLDVVAGGRVPQPKSLAMAVGDDFGVAVVFLVIGRETQIGRSVFRRFGEEVQSERS